MTSSRSVPRTRTRARSPWLFLLALGGGIGLFSSCEAGTEPQTDHDRRLVLDRDTVTLTSLGETLTIRGAVDGADVGVRLTIVEEERWTDELGVAAVDGADVTAVGAGLAVYRAAPASGTDALPDSLVVQVRPALPYISRIEAEDLVGESSPLIVHGYGLAELPMGAIRAEVDPTSITVRDSASVAVHFAPISSDRCTGSAATLTITGAEVIVDEMRFHREREGAMALPVGGTLRVAPEELACLRLDGDADARYALAYYDARRAYWMEDSQPPRHTAERVGVILADLSSGAERLAAPSSRRGLSPAAIVDRREHEAHYSLAPGDSTGSMTGQEWRFQTEPFEVGDTLYVQTGSSSDQAHDVEVVAVVNGYLTLGVPVDSMEAMPVGSIEFYTALAADLDRLHVEWLTELFGRPAVQNGQYLILLYPNPVYGQSGGTATPVFSRLLFSTAGPPLDPDYAHRLYHTMVHEYGHSLWFTYSANIRSTLGEIPYPELWASEGLSDFLGHRATAERAGLAPEGNVPYDHRWHQMVDSHGFFEWGYRSVANVGLDLTWRLAEHSGLSWDAAFDTVATSMVWGRYGCTVSGSCDTFDGLYDVLRRYHGPEWDPVDAMLTYVASWVLDDRVESDLYRIPLMFEVAARSGTLGPGEEVVAYSGATVQAEPVPAGSYGWHLLRGGGGAFAVTADAMDMEWLLIRIP